MYYYCLTVRGAEEREVLLGTLTFLARECSLLAWIFVQGIVVEEISTQLVSELDTCLLTIAVCCYYGKNPHFSTCLVVLGFSVLRKRALYMAPSCSWVAPVRGVGDLGESGVPF